MPSVVSDFPEMGDFVDEYGCGWRIPPFADALAELVEGLTAGAIASRRNNALRASEAFCWQVEEASLLSMYRGLGFSRSVGADGFPDRAAG